MSAFLRACRREPTDYTPVWLMRQAGRYQPSYRAIRAKVDFVTLCKTPSLAAQVTVDAVKQLGVDAAIVFADILLLLEPLGIGFEFGKDDGPKIAEPIRTAARIDAVATEIDAVSSLGYVLETIRLVKRELPEVPLIGFSGAPFTLASYAVEGKGSKDYRETKRLMYADPGAFAELMRRFSDAITRYLEAQIDAGADAVQLFDSWVGCLGPGAYREHVMGPTSDIFRRLGDRVPTIHFGAGNPALLPLVREAGGSVIGVDFRADLVEAMARLEGRAVQGNLDPTLLLAPRDVVLREAGELLARVGDRAGHVFNLGHGILPETDLDTARALVDHVHEATARRRA